MSNNLPRRFWLEFSSAALCAGVATITILAPTWIERLTGLDPDHQNGSLEWVIVLSLSLAAIVLSTFARRDWRRARTVAE